MRPARQIKIITSHLDGFVELKQKLESILDQIHKIITKGETWIQGNDEFGTFSEINQLFDTEMASCLSQLCNIAEEKENDIETNEPWEPNIPIKKSPQQDRDYTHIQNVKEELADVNKISCSLTTSEERNKENYSILNTKYKELCNSFDKLSQSQLAADTKYQSQFKKIVIELHAASDFIQYQTTMFSDKLKTCEDKFTLEINERIKHIELRFNETVSKQIEESDKVNNKKMDKMNIKMKKLTEELDNMKSENERLSSKVNDLEKNQSDVPIRIEALEKYVRKSQTETVTCELIANDNETIPKSLSPLLTKDSQICKDDDLTSDLKVTKTGTIPKGNFETQMAECETMLKINMSQCTKNPGHINFIPIEKFTLSHLPEVYRSANMLQFIKVVADLTVRVAVKMTSAHRPKFWPNTSVLYPFYLTRNKTTLRTGSGMVNCVKKFTDGLDENGIRYVDRCTKCWCRKCQHSHTANHVWWEIGVVTATQVVFDATEASHTSLRFFYDTEESPVVSVDQVSVVGINIERDWCVLKFVTCDKNQAEKLSLELKRYDDLLRKVCSEYKLSRKVDKLAFIVSHPHGCSKHVSVGHWVEKYKVSQFGKQFTYTNCTCPGSSGAKVQCVGYHNSQLVPTGSLDSKLDNCRVS